MDPDGLRRFRSPHFPRRKADLLRHRTVKKIGPDGGPQAIENNVGEEDSRGPRQARKEGCQESCPEESSEGDRYPKQAGSPKGETRLSTLPPIPTEQSPIKGSVFFPYPPTTDNRVPHPSRSL